MLMMLAAAFLAAAAGGCVEPLDPEAVNAGGPVISIQIRLPAGSRPATKGSVDALAAESSIYSLQVWAFLHGDTEAADFDQDAYDAALPLAYRYLSDIGGWRNQHDYVDGDDWENNEDIYIIHIPLPQSVLRMDAADLKLDFYVVANGESIGPFTEDHREYLMTRAEVRDMTFGKATDSDADPFGAVICRSVPANVGLPMSAYYDAGADVSFLLSDPNPAISTVQEYLPVIQLRRAVTRIRFAFSRLQKMNYVYIDAIRIIQNPSVSETDETVILEREYVFSHSAQTSSVATPANPSYETVTWPLNLRWSDMRSTQHPDTLLIRSTETLEDYDARLWADLAGDNPATTQFLLYLRETNRHLAVAIDYRFDRYDDEGHIVAESHTKVIPLEGTNVVFPRNYTANLYAYFLEDAIMFSVSCDAWNEDDITHTNLSPEE